MVFPVGIILLHNQNPTIISQKHATWFQVQKLAVNVTADTLFLMIKVLFHLFYPIKWGENMEETTGCCALFHVLVLFLTFPMNLKI